MTTFTTYRRAIALMGLSALMAGCTVGPDYKAPDISLPQGWFHSAEAMPQGDDQSLIEENWWKRFNDPVLDALIDKALAENLDVKLAEARITEARANRSLAFNALLPTVNIQGSGEREGNQIPFPDVFPGQSRPFNIYQTGFDATWELDLFGKNRRELESQDATLAASQATRDDTRISMLAEVARTYIDIRQYQQLLAITRETITSEQETNKIAKERYRVGDTAKLDVMQAGAQLEQVMTQLPYYENLLSQSELSMDVLLAQAPGTTHALVEQARPIPVADKALLMAAPAQVVANRPDIRVAEQQLKSATAEQGVAVAQLFPDISLSGFLGFLNTEPNELFKPASKSWFATSSVVWPILNYGRLSANIDAADARQQEALLTYRKTIIAALVDVNKSATGYLKQEEFRQAQEKTVADNKQVTSIARMRYKEGLSSFVDVLDAQRTQYASENQLAQSNALVSQDLIAVYTSLGGGWKEMKKPVEPQTPALD